MGNKRVERAEICKRYLKLYTGVVADILDAQGVRTHSLPASIRPLNDSMKIAGPAFTCQGVPTGDITSDDTPFLIQMLEALTPHCVVVLSAGGDTSSSHWGEMMTLSAKQRGCTGAVVDGGVRDAPFILQMNFPIFTKFYMPASSISRWELKECQVAIRVGEIGIQPGDFVFGDLDGVVIIPKVLTKEVLLQAEKAMSKERRMHQALRKGMPLKEAYKRYGAF
ncbi:MAG: RraA family protein [Deltaproteobacteria bacterium]|nr:RraA family protein [Deltaproteobacteria bacterium]